MDDQVEAIVKALRSYCSSDPRLFHITVSSPSASELENALVDSPCFQGLPWELQCSICHSAHELQTAREKLMISERSSMPPVLKCQPSPFIVDSLQRFSGPSISVAMLTG